MKRLQQRLRALWLVLSSRNFILVHGIQEREIQGEAGRAFATTFRTDYSDESDVRTLMLAGLRHARQHAPQVLKELEAE